MIKKHIIAAVLVAASAMLPFASVTVEAAPLEWQMASAFGAGPWFDRDAKNFVERVKLLTEGRLNITPLPSGALGSPLKVTETVKAGVAAVGFNWQGYDWGVDRTTVLFAGYSGGMRTPEEYMLWLYEGGGVALWEQFRRERFGVVSFPCVSLGTEIFLHSRKKIENLKDFKGLKLRTSGAWAEIATRLGASTVVLPGTEVYTALERGVIDATEWGSPEINLPVGFQKVAKYIIVPGIHQAGGFLECEFNVEAWNKLAPRDQEMIRLAAKQSVYESWLKASTADLSAWRNMKKSDNVIVRLAPDFIAKAMEVTDQWSKEQAEKNPWFSKVWNNMRSFKKELELMPEYRLNIGQPLDKPGK
ncbi:MAG: TRAP transporter substrate-binding protein DctP [Burkholderiales bacterium]|nr:TRAP transporter substrate-binding protein DctP [Burkholderiales bacterium]